MALFGKTGTNIQTVVDVGSHTIKALIFEPQGLNTPPKVIKKLVLKLPAAYDNGRVVRKLREFMFGIVKELGKIPTRITIALNPSLAGATLENWEARQASSSKPVSRPELCVYFMNLFEERRDKEHALIAYPLKILANGYAVTPEVLAKSGASKLTFSTLLLSMTPEVGTELAETKKSLGGMPVEYIPLAAAYREAVKRVLKIKDALVIDIGGEETSLVLLKDGEVAGVSAFSLGARHFLKGLAKTAAISFDEAEDLKNQYVQGLVSKAQQTKLHDFLENETGVWKRHFLQALDSFYPSGPLPEQILLTGGGAHFPEIASVVRGSDWLGNFSYLTTPGVKIIEAPNIFGGSSLEGSLQGPEEAGLASLIIYSIYHESLF